MTVYIGAPEPQWLGISDRPLMVSHSRLRRIKCGFTFPVAQSPWLLDSTGYDIVARIGGHLDTPEVYVRAVRAYDARIGNLVWAACQDYPCEASALAATGLTVLDHQVLSIQSYVQLTYLWYGRRCHRQSPFIPIVQGYTPDEYVRCWDMFGDFGVDLSQCKVIGVGSVCGRERTSEIREIVSALRERTGARLHGFGVKSAALHLFDDVDSQAWSYAARKQKTKHPQCTAYHRVCSSCLISAESWHDKAMKLPGAGRHAKRPSDTQIATYDGVPTLRRRVS